MFFSLFKLQCSLRTELSRTFEAKVSITTNDFCDRWEEQLDTDTIQEMCFQTKLRVVL